MNEPVRQRLDKWLWFARILKSRTLAQKLISSGAVRIDGNRVTGPDYRVVPDMVLTMTVNEQLRILKIVDTGERRGPASEAVLLYEDLTPALPPRVPGTRPSKPGAREAGAGRPTKRERRLTDKFTGKGNTRSGG